MDGNVPKIAHLKTETSTQDTLNHADQLCSHNVPKVDYDDFIWEGANVSDMLH